MVFGAIAGMAATMAMTAVMRRLWTRLDAAERYPLPPQEIVESLHGRAAHPRRPGARWRGAEAMAAHFAYGAATGALYGLLSRGGRHGGSEIAAGTAYGVGVWAASYLGWIPAARILAPASRHPRDRNLLMIAAHLAWGAALAAGMRELERASDTAFAPGPAHDALPAGDRGDALLLTVEDRPGRRGAGL